MTIVLGMLSALIIVAVLFIPRCETPLEKRIRDQQVPWETLDQYDEGSDYL